MIFLIRAKGNSCTRKSFWGQQIDTVKYRIKLKLRLFPFFLYYLSVCMNVTYHSQVPDLLHDTRPEGLQCLLGIAARGSKTVSRHLLICSKEEEKEDEKDTRKRSIITKQKTSDMEIQRQIKNVTPLQNKALLHRALPVCQNHISYQSL